MDEKFQDFEILLFLDHVFNEFEGDTVNVDWTAVAWDMRLVARLHAAA